MDCCRIDGSAIFTMDFKIPTSYLGTASSVSNPFRRCISSKNEITAAVPWAITVAIATPATPIPNCSTNHKSRNTFSTEEKMSRNKGVLESPNELNMEERILYINKNGIPKK